MLPYVITPAYGIYELLNSTNPSSRHQTDGLPLPSCQTEENIDYNGFDIHIVNGVTYALSDTL